MDMRVQKTYKSLVEAFEYLLNRFSYEEITVSMLCDKALIRRTTFYKHFTDKENFYRFYIGEKRAELEEFCDARARNLDVGAYRVYLLYTFMTYLMEHETIVNNLFKSSQSAVLINAFADFVTKDIIKTMIEQGSPGNAPAQAEDAPAATEDAPTPAPLTNASSTTSKETPTPACAHPNLDYEYLSAAMSGAMVQTVRQWWANGHKSEDRKKVVEANALIQLQLIFPPEPHAQDSKSHPQGDSPSTQDSKPLAQNAQNAQNSQTIKDHPQK